MRKLSDLMGHALEQREVLRTGRAQLALRGWDEILGQPLNLHAQPEKYDRGVLFVAATGSAWANEIRIRKETLLARLNDRANDARLFNDLRVSVKNFPAKSEE
ncbi:MAG TPA: DUF721 domain-containing protein [Fimbriimonadaceae bacterium]|nr:DUF721 domain-containing protein [Fimbriimonadaceae bacterium]HRJ33136.1 DUF721 domain-containing protein [Fimbriimonadaceae bacterium]